eukprot:m.126 g.126  ORF g.126 m.126 type:complete len:64 (+) comp67_c0_seq1:173-364(+)
MHHINNAQITPFHRSVDAMAVDMVVLDEKVKNNPRGAVEQPSRDVIHRWFSTPITHTRNAQVH